MPTPAPTTAAPTGRAGSGSAPWASGRNTKQAPSTAITGASCGPLRKGITIPNSICFSPDGTTAYFADSMLGQVYSWRLDPEGWPIGAPFPFHRPASPDWAPDGAVIDERGDMWIAYWGGGRVCQVTPDGTARAHVDVPVPQPSCPAFGPDATLFITTAREGMSAEDIAAAPLSGSIFAAPLPVEGLPEPRVILP